MDFADGLSLEWIWESPTRRTTTRDPLILPLSFYVKFCFRGRLWPARGVSPPATLATWSSLHAHKCRGYWCGFCFSTATNRTLGARVNCMPEIAPPFENWSMRTECIWSVDMTRSYVMSNAMWNQWIECILICILDFYVTVTWKFKGQKWMVKLGVFLYITSLDSVFLLYQKLKSSVCKTNWRVNK